MTSKPIVGYMRVSTKKQGESGLGLEAQLQALTSYAEQVGGNILRVYKEVESGKRNDRPELAKALSHAKRSRATLVVAKLDRLSRNVAFLAAVMDSGADFVAWDNPTANRLTLHILAAVAEQEAKTISQRTRVALAAYKARGGVLGGQLPQCRDNLSQEARLRGAVAGGAVTAQRANEAYADLATLMLEMRASGKCQKAIAEALNADGHTTRQGKPWNQVQVMRVLRRFS